MLSNRDDIFAHIACLQADVDRLENDGRHPEKAVVVICEGCGFIQVNPNGECISSDCLKDGHNSHGQRDELPEMAKNFELGFLVKCPWCHGSGHQNPLASLGYSAFDHLETCAACNGTGKVDSSEIEAWDKNDQAIDDPKIADWEGFNFLGENQNG